MGMLQPQPQIQTQKHSGPFSHLRHVQREVSAKAIPSRPFPQRGSNGSSSISRDVPRAQSQRACKPEKHKRFLAFRVQPAGRPSALRPTPESLLRVRIAWHPALPTRPPVIPPSGGRGAGGRSVSIAGLEEAIGRLPTAGRSVAVPITRACVVSFCPRSRSPVAETCFGTCHGAYAGGIAETPALTEGPRGLKRP